MGSCVVRVGHNKKSYLRTEKDEMGEDMKTEYAIKQVGDRYYPVIIDLEAGGHYEIKYPCAALEATDPERSDRPW
jgi:hypothetical protein